MNIHQENVSESIRVSILFVIQADLHLGSFRRRLPQPEFDHSYAKQKAMSNRFILVGGFP